MKQKPFETIDTVFMTRDELVFHKLNGFINSEDAPEIPDETRPGGKLEWCIEQIYEARKQLCEKNDISFEDDPDLEKIIDLYEALCHKIGLLMYQYGFQDGTAYQ